MKKLLIILLVLVLVLVGALGYLGFVPAISSVLGTDQPRDLGVNPRPEDLTAAKEKMNGVQFTMLSSYQEGSSGSAAQPGSVPVSVSFTSQEITAMLKTGDWQGWPIMDAQVKINPDGSAEASGVLMTSLINDMAAMAGYSSSDVRKALDTLHIKGNVPVYLKGRGDITNNQVNLSIEKAEVGRFPVPSSLVNQHQGDINNFVSNSITKMPQVSVDSLRVENGQAAFDGSLPSYCPHW